jgi:hypothetical protein
VFVNSVGALTEAITAVSARCILADAQLELSDLTSVVRANGATCGVPLIAVTEGAAERTLLEMHALGVDDVVQAHDAAGIMRRVNALAKFDPAARTSVIQGRCLLAHGDATRRAVVGRSLRQAGFEVSFAVAVEDQRTSTESATLKLVVASEPLLPTDLNSARRLLAWAIERKIPVVLLRSAADTRPRLEGCVYVQESAPPDDLLFVVNELLRPRALVEGRASRRLVLARLCAFREPSETGGRLGLTYNISREGLYVRTLDAPPQHTEVWLEVQPEGSRICHLRGEVVWTRSLSTGALGAVPPGFGVRLKPEWCPVADHVAYLAYYDSLFREVTAAEHACLGAEPTA